MPDVPQTHGRSFDILYRERMLEDVNKDYPVYQEACLLESPMTLWLVQQLTAIT